MSLVAYDSSDDSEEEKTSKIVPTNEKKKKEAVKKITIPSLKEFEDVEDAPTVKKPKLQSSTGSGLIGLLPPPKNMTTLNKPGFMPHVLKSNKEQSSSAYRGSKTAVVSVISKAQESDEEILSTKDKSQEETETASVCNDFFWLDDLASNKKSVQENENVVVASTKSSNIFQNLSSQLPSPSNNSIKQLYQNESQAAYFQQNQQLSETKVFQAEINSEQASFSPMEQTASIEDYSVNSSGCQLSANDLLKDKEFLKLQGRKREFENIDIIDVNADDQITDKNEWLMKSLTEESTHRPSRKKHCMPTQQQKRKHQITYLAFQAKEREGDLKNQWALNSRTRRETQAKYGF